MTLLPQKSFLPAKQVLLLTRMWSKNVEVRVPEIQWFCCDEWRGGRRRRLDYFNRQWSEPPLCFGMALGQRGTLAQLMLTFGGIFTTMQPVCRKGSALLVTDMQRSQQHPTCPRCFAPRRRHTVPIPCSEFSILSGAFRNHFRQPSAVTNQ